MADFSKFRTSIGGFNRSDVSDYIENLCAEHRKELRQCEDEKTALTDKLAKAEKTLSDQRRINQALLEQMQEKDAALRAALEAEAQAKAEMEAEAMEEAPLEEAEAEEEPDYPSMELEAYRRAEAAERLAMERAARLRQSLNDLLESVANRYEEAGQEIHALTEDMRTNLKRLEETLSDLDLLFDETTDSFETLDSDDAAMMC